MSRASGNPSETLTNIVELIQRRFDTDVCSVYLLEPDRANLVLAATIGLRPDSVGRVRMRLTEGLAGLVGRAAEAAVVVQTPRAPAVQVLPRGGRRSLPLVPRRAGRRPRTCCRACSSCRRVEPRAFSDDDVRMLVTAGAQLAPIVERGAGARAVRRAGAPAAVGACAEPVVELGQRERQPVPRSRPDPLAAVRPQSDRPARSRLRPTRSRSAASQLALHSRINYAYRRLKEYLQSKHTWGARHAGVLGARPVAYFSAEFGLHESVPIYSGGLGVLSGDHIKSASDLGVPLVGVGLFYDQGYFQQQLDRDGWQQEEYIDVDSRIAADGAGRRGDGEPVTVDDRDAHRHASRARVWLVRVGRDDAAAARLERRGQQPRGPRADGPALRRRRSARASARSWCSASAACARWHALGITPGVFHLNEGHSAFATLELIRAADGERRHRRRRGDARRGARRPSSPRTRRCRPATTASRRTLIEEHLGPLRDALGHRRTTQLHGAGPRRAARPSTSRSA